MNIACVLSAAELPFHADLILFPEGVSISELQAACAAHPKSIVAGAVPETGQCRGLLLRGGVQLVSYLKVLGDGRTQGSANVDQHPVFDDGVSCIGLLVCKDIDEATLAPRVINAIQSSSSSRKILCIPADMGSEWFPDITLLPQAKYSGFNVVLCNHVKTHQVRCKSFITNQQGTKVVIQQGMESLHKALP